MAERRPKRSPTRERFPFLDTKIQCKCKLIKKPTMITKSVLNMKKAAHQCANSKCLPRPTLPRKVKQEKKRKPKKKPFLHHKIKIFLQDISFNKIL